MTDRTCSEQSCDVDEGLAGTAAEASQWILLEYTGEWKPKGYDQAALPDVARAAIDAAVEANPTTRVQLIRRAEPKPNDSRVRLILARSERGRTAIWEHVLDRYEDLAALDLVAWALGVDPFAHARVSGPLYLVCVHGKRDRCCAQKGMPIYRKLAHLRPEATWQTTHLGGHRFAATLVCLPEGICYGRVEESEADVLVAAHERGDIYALERYRGRSCDDALIQAAERWLRATLEDRALDALAPVGTQPSGADTEVAFDLRSGERRTIRVTRRAVLPIQQSCGAPERKAAWTFVPATQDNT